MKRKTLISAAALLVGAGGVFVAIKIVPAVRLGLKMRRHVREAIRREPQVLAAWNREFGEPAALLARYPKQPDDERAFHLIELAGRVGMNMARINTKGQDPSSGRPHPEQSLRQAIGDYVNGELQTVGKAIQPPPATVRSFLDAHRSAFTEIIDFLAEGPPPRWMVNAGRGYEAPLPNLLGQLHLQRMLVAGALSQDAVGDDGGADRTLRASWNLNLSIRDRPDLVSQLVAISVARMHVGLLRHQSGDPEEWNPMVIDHDYRSGLLTAMRVEFCGSWNNRAGATTQEDRASRVDYLDTERRFLMAMRDSPVSDGDAHEILDALASRQGALAPADEAEPIAIPNLLETLRRANRLIVDTELTEKIFEARALKAKLGNWPRDIPGIEKSRMKDARWIYSVTPQGRMTIALSRPLNWGETVGLVLPVRYEAD